MNIDLKNTVEKGIRLVEQASVEDKAHNYELAMKAYMAASDCFSHVIKYGILNEEMKQSIHAKIENCTKRAVEIKNNTGNETAEKEQSTDNNVICSRIKVGNFVADPKVTFDDVIGLADAKTTLLEDVILPVKYPEVFQDKHKSSPYILLYGPPGVGKTYLAKSVATECKSAFIWLSSWELYTKWSGHNEKNIESLFQLARERQPCILILDDIDGVFGERNDPDWEPFRQCRVAEFLTQMEDLRKDNTNVFLLAVTNSPWTLGVDLRRKFEKQMYISLPELHERVAMFKTHLGTDIRHTIKDEEWIQLAEKADQYSGADLSVVCREALIRPIRQLSTATHFKRVPNLESNDGQQLWSICSVEDPDAQMITLDKIDPNELYIPPTTMSDMSAALNTIKHSLTEADMIKYWQYTEECDEDVALKE